jgi:hypothetical protein
MKLRRLDKAGNELFCKEYKDKKLAETILRNSSTYNTGEKMWEVVTEKPKGRPKKVKDEDSKE